MQTQQLPHFRAIHILAPQSDHQTASMHSQKVSNLNGPIVTHTLLQAQTFLCKASLLVINSIEQVKQIHTPPCTGAHGARHVFSSHLIKHTNLWQSLFQVWTGNKLVLGVRKVSGSTSKNWVGKEQLVRWSEVDSANPEWWSDLEHSSWPCKPCLDRLKVWRFGKAWFYQFK